MDEYKNETIEGRNAVTEALRAGRALDKVFIARGETDRALAFVAAKARAAGVTVVEYLKKHVIINYAVEVCTMLINGVLEFCWQKFVIYRKEEGSALAKYEEGTVGEFGEIGIKDRGYDGADLLELMRDGEDISEMTDKDIRKAVEARAAADRKATVVR